MAIDVCMGLHQECNSVPSEDKTEVDVPCESNDSLNNLHKNCGSNLDSITPSKSKEHQTFMQDTVVDMELPSTSSITRSKLYCEGHIGDESLKAVDKQHSDDIYLEDRTRESIETVLIPEPYQLADKQNSAFIMTGAEMETVLKERTCDIADKIMILEQHQPPKRLLSTHKAFPPSSEEQLRLAMNSCKTCKDSNQNLLECKKKLFENQTEESSPRSDIQNDEVTAHHGYPGKVSQRKVTTRPRCMIRKSQIAKGNLEGHRLSHAFPNLITGCTTVQACSESAIAFSQRQMHDIESLAKKLMNELKSMKDIIEQKLLFEANRNASVKNDADGVKSAIDKTTKVEETAKRLISMMARDCARFCKIMKMAPDSTSTSKDRVTSIRRKIMFADEAGGELCQIKYFDDDVATQVPDQS